MNPYGGLLFAFDEPEHRESLLLKIQSKENVTFGVSNRDLEPGDAEICLLSFDKESLGYICLAHSPKASETARLTLKLDRLTNFRPIKTEEFARWPILKTTISNIIGRIVTRVDAKI